jgi:hypothetical protein
MQAFLDQRGDQVAPKTRALVLMGGAEWLGAETTASLPKPDAVLPAAPRARSQHAENRPT